MHERFRLILLFLTCFQVLSARSDTIPVWSSGFRTEYGFIIPHSPAVEPVSHTNPYGFGLNFSRLHASPTDRKVFNAYWISGFQAAFYNFQNTRILGGAFSLTLFAEPVVAFGQRFMFTVRGGAGLSYHTVIYDVTTNPENQFFSTRMNFPLYINAIIKYRLRSELFLTVSANYNHISNGGFRQPNYGMNFPTLAAGIEFFHKPFRGLEHVRDEKRPFSGKVFYTAGMLSAVRVLDKTDLYREKKTMALGFNAGVSKPLSSYYILNGGVEIILDGYFKEVIEREQTGIDYKRVALLAGQDFRFGNFYFSQYLGIYLYSPYKAKNPIYQKYMLSYRFRSGLMTGIFLKAHLQEAEMMGITLSLMPARDKTIDH